MSEARRVRRDVLTAESMNRLADREAQSDLLLIALAVGKISIGSVRSDSGHARLEHPQHLGHSSLEIEGDRNNRE